MVSLRVTTGYGLATLRVAYESIGKEVPGRRAVRKKRLRAAYESIGKEVWCMEFSASAADWELSTLNFR